MCDVMPSDLGGGLGHRVLPAVMRARKGGSVRRRLSDSLGVTPDVTTRSDVTWNDSPAAASGRSIAKRTPGLHRLRARGATSPSRGSESELPGRTPSVGTRSEPTFASPVHGHPPPGPTM